MHRWNRILVNALFPLLDLRAVLFAGFPLRSKGFFALSQPFDNFGGERFLAFAADINTKQLAVFIQVLIGMFLVIPRQAELRNIEYGLACRFIAVLPILSKIRPAESFCRAFCSSFIKDPY